MSKSAVSNYIIISLACVFFMWTWRYSHQPTLIPQPISQVFLPTGLNESRMSDDWLHSNPQSEINAYVLKWYIPLSWMNIMGSYDYCYWLSFIADLKCLKDSLCFRFHQQSFATYHCIFNIRDVEIFLSLRCIAVPTWKILHLHCNRAQSGVSILHKMIDYWC